MSAVASVARARCSALLTEATLVSSSSAASLACHFSTSQRMSAARCFGGRCCERGDEREAQGVALLRELVRRRERGDPGHLRQLGEVLEQRLLRRPEIHRPRPALAPGERVVADVRRDPVQPRLERRAALEPVERAPRAHHRLLHRVLGVERRAEHAVAVAGQLAAVLLEGLGRGGLGCGHDRHPRQAADSRQPAAARSSSAMSILTICSMAAITRWTFSGSGSPCSSSSRFGMICQARP